MLNIFTFENSNMTKKQKYADSMSNFELSVIIQFAPSN